LFGDVPAPSSMADAEPMITEEDLAAMPIIPPLPRLARGTESERQRPSRSLAQQLAPLENPARGSTPSIEPGKLHAGSIRTFTGWAPAPAVVDDDQPTRGRYIMRRPPTSPGDHRT
jgi:hypothetical protein